MPFLVFLLSFDRKNHKIGYLPSIEANFVFSDPRKDSYGVRRKANAGIWPLAKQTTEFELCKSRIGIRLRKYSRNSSSSEAVS